MALFLGIQTGFTGPGGRHQAGYKTGWLLVLSLGHKIDNSDDLKSGGVSEDGGAADCGHLIQSPAEATGTEQGILFYRTLGSVPENVAGLGRMIMEINMRDGWFRY